MAFASFLQSARQQSEKAMSTIAKPPLLRMIAMELLALVLLSVAVIPAGMTQAYSLFAGGLIHTIGSIYFARLTFRHRGARQLGSSVQSMYRGETGKIVLSAVLFVTVFLFVRPLGVIAFFSGYAAMVIVHLWVTARILKQHKP